MGANSFLRQLFRDQGLSFFDTHQNFAAIRHRPADARHQIVTKAGSVGERQVASAKGR
jgi:hypothetical protein